MPRPALPLGSWGKITRTQQGNAAWVAKARVRDLDGITRLVERSGRTGAAAERNLVAALTERTAPTTEDLSPNTRLTALWDAYLGHLRTEGRSPRTFERYEYVAGYVVKGLGGLRIREATTQRLDGFLKALAANSGPSVAVTARVILSGMFGLAVRYDAITHNPVRDVGNVRTAPVKKARALTVDELRGILDAVHHSPIPINPGNKVRPGLTLAEYCAEADLADVVTMFAGTGARISEVLGIRWEDINLDAKTVAISGKVGRTKGQGMIREGFLKSEAGERTLPLPGFAVAMLLRRQVESVPNLHNAVFPSSTGSLRDPSAVSKQWRKVRDRLGFDWVTSHTFRKTVATMIDAQGLSARVGADQLGHANVSMTQDRYHGRKTTHVEVAEVLDQAVRRRLDV
ncbi:site-specific integrase [Paenarthrobacter sp. DKR-5]|uniref:site-specific integrase n=1 Tax=Paenarthrobacter sp. DKR-5 TaxID=2835535 RepID=UPI001BDD55A7|nr:site-specific integrase [Paenarthrobacter sp. DKR-5]MBT1002631.1 site-specific integrase [Paenarthrobacter sp. DKR-5]